MNTIYLITNKINNKKYVGQTWEIMGERWKKHYSPSEKSCVKLNRAIKKYGKNNFIVEEITTSFTQKDADELEVKYIQEYDTIRNGYNIRLGGSRGKHSEETKQKMSVAAMGRRHSDDSKRKMSLAKIGKNHPNFGKSLSSKTKQNISKANKGREMSDIWKKRLSDSHVGKHSKPLKVHILDRKDIPKAIKAGVTKTYLAKQYNVSRQTIYRILKEEIV